MEKKLTQQEMDLLASCYSEDDWEMACEAIKEVRGGAYPPDWYSRVLGNGLMDNILSRWGASSALKVQNMDGTEIENIGTRPTDPAPANDDNNERVWCPSCNEYHTKEDRNPTDPLDAMLLGLLKLLVASGAAKIVKSDKDPRTMTQEEIRALYESQGGDLDDIEGMDLIPLGFVPKPKKGDGGEH